MSSQCLYTAKYINVHNFAGVDETGNASFACVIDTSNACMAGVIVAGDAPSEHSPEPLQGQSVKEQALFRYYFQTASIQQWKESLQLQ